MLDAHDLLRTLAVVLCVAAVTTVIFQRLRQPVVFGYLFAGMIVGPHVPVPIGVATSAGAILFSAAIGLLFGGWPAIRASRLSPIEALRTE